MDPATPLFGEVIGPDITNGGFSFNLRPDPGSKPSSVVVSVALFQWDTQADNKLQGSKAVMFDQIALQKQMQEKYATKQTNENRRMQVLMKKCT